MTSPDIHRLTPGNLLLETFNNHGRQIGAVEEIAEVFQEMRMTEYGIAAGPALFEDLQTP
jgi:hypothetical protein